MSYGVAVSMPERRAITHLGDLASGQGESARACCIGIRMTQVHECFRANPPAMHRGLRGIADLQGLNVADDPTT